MNVADPRAVGNLAHRVARRIDRAAGRIARRAPARTAIPARRVAWSSRRVTMFRPRRRRCGRVAWSSRRVTMFRPPRRRCGRVARPTDAITAMASSACVGEPEPSSGRAYCRAPCGAVNSAAICGEALRARSSSRPFCTLLPGRNSHVLQWHSQVRLGHDPSGTQWMQVHSSSIIAPASLLTTN